MDIAQAEFKKYVDWENRTLKGKTRTYKILPETISAARKMEYDIRAIGLMHQLTTETFMQSLNEIRNTLTKGEDNMAGNIHKVLTMIDDIRNNIVKFVENKRTPLFEFCGLFCIYENEDVSKYDDEIMIEKWNDLKHIPDVVFFLLSTRAIPTFRDVYLSILNEKER